MINGEQQRRDGHLEKAVARSVEEDPALRRAEEEHKRKLAEIESDDGARGCEAEREVKRQNHDEQTDQNMNQPGDDVRGIRRRQKAKKNRRRQNAPEDWLLREETA